MIINVILAIIAISLVIILLKTKKKSKVTEFVEEEEENNTKVWQENIETKIFNENVINSATKLATNTDNFEENLSGTLTTQNDNNFTIKVYTPNKLFKFNRTVEDKCIELSFDNEYKETQNGYYQLCITKLKNLYLLEQCNENSKFYFEKRLCRHAIFEDNISVKLGNSMVYIIKN